MGEVYRARDTRLGREVAVKILPAEFASDPGRLARFEQEARAAAALNHPNILGLYDIGSENGVSYMVTELVAGETLAARLEEGPLPIPKLLDIAVQVAEGMACAHAARITHRDLKPANIMITGPESGQAGRAKILDFGLAKQASVAASADETVAMNQTEPGMIVGTVNYMSPEQARAKPTDYRSDQFSFGIILYEMATGKKAFERAETVQTMSAILTEEPPPIERNIPAPLRWAIERCLAKDPADRYESTRDLARDLRYLCDHLSEASSTSPAALPAVAAPVPRGRTRWQPVASAFAAGLLVALVAMLLLRRTDVPDQSTYHFTPFSFEPGGQGSVVWAPDGKSVAYAVAPPAGAPQVFLRSLDSPTPVQITHIAEDANPIAWTPDGQRILFNSHRQGPSLWSVARVGGEPEKVLSYPASIVAPTTISPDGRAVAILATGSDGRAGVHISTPLGAPFKPYPCDPFATRSVYNVPKLCFSPDGKKIVLLLNGERRKEEAWLLPYPADSAHPPRRVLTGVGSIGGTPEFSWMPDSRHVVLALQTSAEGATQLWMADTASDRHYALTSGTTDRSTPIASPDGQRLMFAEVTSNFDVVSADLATAAVRPLIATERTEVMPAWAAKRPLLVYITNRNGPAEIWLHSPDSLDRPLITAKDFPDRTQWFHGPTLSPEGDRVIFARAPQGGTGSALYLAAVTGGGVVRLTNDSSGTEFSGSWSPDGNWFVYGRYRDGKTTFLKVKTTGQAQPVLLREGDRGTVPSWSPTGEWIAAVDKLISPDGQTVRSVGDHNSLFYMFSADGKLLYGVRSEKERNLLFSVDVATGAEKVIGDLGKDFRPVSGINPGIRLSLAPDGKSFTYSTRALRRNLWMLEGFAPKTGILARLGLR
jgi:serine/threonine protein kinase